MVENDLLIELKWFSNIEEINSVKPISKQLLCT